MAVFYGENNKRYILTEEIASGGEGKIYKISGSNNLVAKIYSLDKYKTTTAKLNYLHMMERKIQTMIEQPVECKPNGILSICWPKEILYRWNNIFAGFIMDKVDDNFHIFSASRERERNIYFKNYSFSHSLIIAYNLATVVDYVHSCGYVIGDLNSNNIMLDKKGHVILIDTDSFNVVNNNSKEVFKCTVAVGEFLAPELQNKSLKRKSSVFTTKSDNFALAIHIFILLMNNCHPFACKNYIIDSHSTGEKRMENNIINGYCPYVSASKGNVSKSAPDINYLPKEIRELFENCFRYTPSSACRKTTINKRPTAQQWRSALWNEIQKLKKSNTI